MSILKIPIEVWQQYFLIPVSQRHDNFKTVDQLFLGDFTISVINGYYYGEKFGNSPTGIDIRKSLISISLQTLKNNIDNRWFLKKLLSHKLTLRLTTAMIDADAKFN